jgi:DNA-dependent protein kinase catalytic subunit
MVYTLEALQKKKDILISTMDVFVKEPLIDWEKLARRLAVQQTEGDAAGDGKTWFPQKKIEIAARKLNLENPAHVMIEELENSVHHGKPYLQQVKAIVQGNYKKPICRNSTIFWNSTNFLDFMLTISR